MLDCNLKMTYFLDMKNLIKPIGLTSQVNIMTSMKQV